MRKDTPCDIYEQSEDVVKKYEDLAFLKLANDGKIECCGGGHPAFGRKRKLFLRTLCDLYEADKRKKSK